MSAACFAVVLEMACGYDGQASSVPNSPDGGGKLDGSVDGPPDCAAPTCSLPTAPAGWELVLLGAVSDTPDAGTENCPAGFDSADSLENPVATAGACTCATCVTAGTNCSTDSIATAYDMGGGACGLPGAALASGSGACVTQGGIFGQDVRVDAPTAVPGTCTSAPVSNRASVAGDRRRLCTRQASTCSARACGAAGSLHACVARPGDVACPAGGPSTKHLVGSDFAVTCAACGCSITSATCGGELEFYAQDLCLGTPVTFAVGVCKPPGATGFRSTKWKPLVANENCATVAGAPTTAIVGAQTICCP